jgi:hypothetical protein
MEKQWNAISEHSTKRWMLPGQDFRWWPLPGQQREIPAGAARR